METQCIIETVLSPNKCYHSVLKKNYFMELHSRILSYCGEELFTLPSLASKCVELRISPRIHTSRKKKANYTEQFFHCEKQQNSTPTTNCKFSHICSRQTFAIFTANKAFGSNTHFFCLLPPFGKNHSLYFQKTRKNTQGKISDNIMLILGI